MAGKRGNNEGSIRLRADGRYEARITLEGGRHKSYYGATRQEAAQKMHAALRAHETGHMLALDERLTVKHYLAGWLETVKPTLKQSSYERYEQAVRTHVLPALGSLRLTKLSAHQLQTFYTEKLSEGLSPSTVAHLHAVLHRALRAAERLDLVPRNVAERVTAPRATHHEMHFFTAEQAQAILKGVAGERLEALYVLALTTGARQGELLGLKWRTVDLTAGTIRIEQTLHFDKGGAWRLDTPKTERSRRTIELPLMAVEALRAHRALQAEERLAMGEAWHDHGFVFTNAIGEPLRGTHLLERHFLPLLKRLGLPAWRWHDLRHTFVSLASGEGVQDHMISKMIGHSSTSMTIDVYRHILPTEGKAAALAMERVLLHDSRERADQTDGKADGRLPG